MLFNKEECAKGMGQSSNNVNVAPSMDVPFMPSEEECAEGLEQRLSDVASTDDSPIKLPKEACAKGMWGKS